MTHENPECEQALAWIRARAAELNDELRDLVMMQKAIKEMTLKIAEEWSRLQVESSMDDVDEENSIFLLDALMMLRNAERELSKLGDLERVSPLCTRCGQPLSGNNEPPNPFL